VLEHKSNTFSKTTTLQFFLTLNGNKDQNFALSLEPTSFRGKRTKQDFSPPITLLLDAKEPFLLCS
jgi:hypothetical protein